MNIKEFVDAARAGITTVTFKKINTDEVRVMPCTLNEEILKEHGIEMKLKSVGPDSDHVACFALDKKAWRSFRVSTVISWSKGEPKQETSNQGSDI
jgi:hypothetical protein